MLSDALDCLTEAAGYVAEYAGIPHWAPGDERAEKVSLETVTLAELTAAIHAVQRLAMHHRGDGVHRG